MLPFLVGFSGFAVVNLSILTNLLVDIIHSAEHFSVANAEQEKANSLGMTIALKRVAIVFIHHLCPGSCSRCGYMSSNELCKACVLLDGLNNGQPKIAIGKRSKKVCVRILLCIYRLY